MMRTFHSLFCLWLLLLGTASAAEEYSADDFVELRSGIGEEYPVMDVVAPGEKLTVLRQRADWFLLRSGEQKSGWVSAQQVGRIVATRPAGNVRTSRLHQGMQLSVGAGWAEKDSVARVALGYSFGSGGMLLDHSKISGEFLHQQRQLLMAHWTPRVWRNLMAGVRVGIGRLIEQPKYQRVDISEKELSMSMLGGSLGWSLGRSASLSFDGEWNAPEGRDAFLLMGISVHGFYSL